MMTLTKVLFLAGLAAAQTRVQSQWGQCAGSSYAGPTACPKNYYCSFGKCVSPTSPEGEGKLT